MKVLKTEANSAVEVGSFIKAKAFESDKEQIFQVCQMSVDGGLNDVICLVSSCDGKIQLKEISDNGQPIKDIQTFQECLGVYFGAKATYEVLTSITFGA